MSRLQESSTTAQLTDTWTTPNFTAASFPHTLAYIEQVIEREPSRTWVHEHRRAAIDHEHEELAALAELGQRLSIYPSDRVPPIFPLKESSPDALRAEVADVRDRLRRDQTAKPDDARSSLLDVLKIVREHGAPHPDTLESTASSDAEYKRYVNRSVEVLGELNLLSRDERAHLNGKSAPRSEAIYAANIVAKVIEVNSTIELCAAMGLTSGIERLAMLSNQDFETRARESEAIASLAFETYRTLADALSSGYLNKEDTRALEDRLLNGRGLARLNTRLQEAEGMIELRRGLQS